MKAETVTFTKVAPIADADKVPIRVGSVLREINDGERGVVTRIVRAGEMGTIFDAIGDVQIYVERGTTRVTNRYDQWRHIPKDEQTYDERYLSWLRTPFNDDLSILTCGEKVPKDERIAIDGIMALLPSSIVHWETGPWPDRLEQALCFLKEHLTSISATPTPHP